MVLDSQSMIHVYKCHQARSQGVTRRLTILEWSLLSTNAFSRLRSCRSKPNCSGFPLGFSIRVSNLSIMRFHLSTSSYPAGSNSNEQSRRFSVDEVGSHHLPFNNTHSIYLAEIPHISLHVVVSIGISHGTMCSESVKMEEALS